ncbi:MAG: hypothetical protein QOI34_1032 [Verrucomicrobiota bacterium]|jgi:hypothetical protein
MHPILCLDSRFLGILKVFAGNGRWIGLSERDGKIKARLGRTNLSAKRLCLSWRSESPIQTEPRD